MMQNAVMTSCNDMSIMIISIQRLNYLDIPVPLQVRGFEEYNVPSAILYAIVYFDKFLYNQMHNLNI